MHIDALYLMLIYLVLAMSGALFTLRGIQRADNWSIVGGLLLTTLGLVLLLSH